MHTKNTQKPYVTLTFDLFMTLIVSRLLEVVKVHAKFHSTKQWRCGRGELPPPPKFVHLVKSRLLELSRVLFSCSF